jgi:predicted nuclease with TOPRIM domain
MLKPMVEDTADTAVRVRGEKVQLQEELERARAENARLCTENERLRGENKRLRGENEQLRTLLDAHVTRANSPSLFGSLELTAGTCVVARRQRRRPRRNGREP